MTAHVLDRVVLTANDRFKDQYGKVLRWSAVVAMVLTIVFCLVAPRYEPTPYRLRQEALEIVSIQTLVELPPEPKPAPRPPPCIEPAPDLEVPEDPDIPPMLIPVGEYVFPPPVQQDHPGSLVFVASASNPELLHLATPDYPLVARMSRLEGTVVVHVLVGPEGRVLEVKVAQPGHPVLNRAALAAAWKCLFRPGLQRDRPVPAWVGIPFRFRLH